MTSSPAPDWTTAGTAEVDLSVLIAALPSLQGREPRFNTAAAPDAPGPLFREWFLLAVEAGVFEPHVMTLATVNDSGLPDSRFLVMKDFDPAGRWAFASSADSAKDRQLAAHPVAAATFYWPSIARSIRLRGRVAAATAGVSAANFRSRTPGARAIALAGTQSAPLSDLATLDADLRAAEQRLDADPDLVLDRWCLYWLTAEIVEFWQADPGRKHRRLRYTRHDAGWQRTLLRP